MEILKAGLVYFVVVFGAGFILGPIRLRWDVPRFGTRMAELLETLSKRATSEGVIHRAHRSFSGEF